MIKIGDRIISEDSPVFIIAEAGVNHNGDLAVAKQMIDAALEAGVDAVKFQTYRTEEMITVDAKKADYQLKRTEITETQYAMLKKYELSPEDHRELVGYCRNKGLIFLSTPYDLASVDLLSHLGVLCFKISSGDLTNLPFLSYIAGQKKPIILSTGMSNLGEIERAVLTIEKSGNSEIVLLHCTTNYPTAYQDVNLKAMITLKNAFQYHVGYSDHTEGIIISLAAVSMGARIIEKHFTLDRRLPGPDHQASLEPKELQELVTSIRYIERAMGNGVKRCVLSEEKNKEIARKKIVLACDVSKGTVITKKELALKRADKGLASTHLDLLIGHKVNRDLFKDHAIEFFDLDD